MFFLIIQKRYVDFIGEFVRIWYTFSIYSIVSNRFNRFNSLFMFNKF